MFFLLWLFQSVDINFYQKTLKAAERSPLSEGYLPPGQVNEADMKEVNTRCIIS